MRHLLRRIRSLGEYGARSTPALSKSTHCVDRIRCVAPSLYPHRIQSFCRTMCVSKTPQPDAPKALSNESDFDLAMTDDDDDIIHTRGKYSDQVDLGSYVEPDFESLCRELNIADDDSGTRQKLHLAMLERSSMYMNGELCPMQVPVFQWRELLLLNSFASRQRYFTFLAKKQYLAAVSRLKLEAKRNERREEYSHILERIHSESALSYGLGTNSLLLRVYDSTVDTWRHWRMMQSVKFGPRIVFDMTYEDDMTRREMRNMVIQLCNCFVSNRRSKEPLSMHLCGLQPESESMKQMKKILPIVGERSCPISVHEHSYMDIFDPSRLVYLSPHTSKELEHYDPNDVYIIGAYVDKAQSLPLSLARAKRNGIRAASLPLKKYLRFDSSFNPSLTLVAVTDILLSLSVGESWPQALRHVPTRRQIAEDDEAYLKEQRLRKERIQRKIESKTRLYNKLSKRFL